MKEMGIVAWNWIAVGAIMGLLAVMIALGIGRKRGTWLHGLRLALWAIVVGGAGAAGCSEQDITGQADAGDPASEFDGISCYVPQDTYEAPAEVDEPDTDEPDVSLDGITCYQMPYPDEDAVEPDEGDAEEEG